MSKFLYQALQRAAGALPDAPEQEQSVPAPAPALPTSVTAMAANPGLQQGPGVEVPASSRRVKALRMAEKLEHMVAYLSHPVIDENVLAMEQIRLLRTRLMEVMRTRKLRTVLMTSALPGEGKTLMAVNLAFSMSQVEGKRVLLVDADFRRPSVANFLKSEFKDGLSGYLLEGKSLEEVTYQARPSLDVAPTSTVADSAGLINGPRMQSFLREAADTHDLVIVDAPPIFPIADAEAMLPLVDGAVMVVRAHQTSYELARQAAQRLHNKAVGVVLNCADRMPHSDYYYTQTAKREKNIWSRS